VDEIGRTGAVGYLKKSPSITYRLTQLEYGSIEFWQKLVNSDVKGNDAEDVIDLDDFKTSYFDICAYLTDDNGDFLGTIWYPSLRTSGFSLTIGEPQGTIERGFDLVGEAAIQFQGVNKYFHYQREPVAGDDTDYEITLEKTAAVDPDTALKYMQRVVRVTVAGVSSELSKSGEDYIEDATTVTIATVATGDIIKLYYTTADDLATGETLFTEQGGISALLGDSVSIFLYVPGTAVAPDTIQRLQSATIEASFDREDIRELGNKDVVARGISNKTVTISLGRILQDYTIEEVLRGEAAGFGKIDVSKLGDDISLIIKVYGDNTKDASVFQYGIKATGLSPTELRGGAGVNEYSNRENSLEGESLIITKDLDELGFTS